MNKLNENNYFVLAAVVATELHNAMLVAREISLTASNARALALRAGHGAAGFRAITDFIDELADKTIKASREINGRAVAMSRVASESVNAATALEKFEAAYKKGKDAKYLNTLDTAVERTRQQHAMGMEDFDQRVKQLTGELSELARELRTATVLAAMSRVEASQAGVEYEASLNVIAENVAEAAERIHSHVMKSQNIFSQI